MKSFSFCGIRLFPMRAAVLFALIFTVTMASSTQEAWSQGLISKGIALQSGLTRMWFAQASCDSANTLRNISINDTMLLIQGRDGSLEAMDGETGRHLWNASDRVRGTAFTVPGVCRRMIAVISGTRLFVLNRENGKLLWQVSMANAGTTAPMISNFRIVVPLMDGRLATWPVIPEIEWAERLEDEKAANPTKASQINAEKWTNLRLDKKMYDEASHFVSLGSVENPVVATLRLPGSEFYVWTSDKGLVYVSKLYTNRNGLNIQPVFQTTLETPTTRQIAYVPPKGYPIDRAAAMALVEKQNAAGAGNKAVETNGAGNAGQATGTDEVTMRVTPEGVPQLSLDGDLGAIVIVDERGLVYAFDLRTGVIRWRNSIQSRPLDHPVAIGRQIFVHSTLGGTFCIDGDSGEVVWNVKEPLRFIAASATRFYGEDSLGRISIRSLADGSPIGMLPTTLQHTKLVNTQTDRIYIAAQDGLVQCFCETAQESPILRTLLDPDPKIDSEFIAGLRKKDQQGKAAATSTADVFDPFANAPDGNAVVPEEPSENPFSDMNEGAFEENHTTGTTDSEDPFAGETSATSSDTSEDASSDVNSNDTDPFAE
ncbi:MAG: PQQ-binding-like beta-propeller repeat protein [Thermoguttaceae bacterium]|nr:PQQ-binding-like beta-propeller repeat protein [Thermoguttaceae bacterium]